MSSLEGVKEMHRKLQNKGHNNKHRTNTVPQSQVVCTEDDGIDGAQQPQTGEELGYSRDVPHDHIDHTNHSQQNHHSNNYSSRPNHFHRGAALASASASASAVPNLNRPINNLESWPGRGPNFKPPLLKKLERYLITELRNLNQQYAKPNATRMKVYRGAFQKFIEEFKSYDGFLTEVKDEYDALLNLYSSKLHAIPTMQAEILSLRKGSNQNIENLQMMFAKEKKELKESLREQVNIQRNLERENEGLREKMIEQGKELQQHKDRFEDLKGSTITLTNALVRLEDDNSIRALSEGNQQSEVLRLKNALEKANSEVDRLKNQSVDMEEQITNLVAPELLEEKEKQILVIRREMGQMRNQYRTLNSKYTTLTASLSKSREDFENADETMNPSRAVPSGPPVSQSVVEDLINKVEQLKAQLDEGKTANVTANEDENIEDEVYVPDGNYFRGKGIGQDVPKFLRYEGVIRNWRLSKRECERTVNDIWIGKETYQEENDTIKTVSLQEYVYIFLKEKFDGKQALIAEFGYNFEDALERYKADSDCLIFLLILQGELAEEVRDDQLHLLVMIPSIMEDEDIALHNGKSSGLLPIPVFMRNLRKILTTKSESSFAKLQKALQFEAKKGRMVAYNELFEEDEDGNQGDFCELLRAQHLEEIISYDKQLRNAITDAHNKEGSNGRLSVSLLRDVIQSTDPNKKRAEINVYLARGCNCDIKKLGELEANNEEVDVKSFITLLRNGLVKKSEATATKNQ